MDLMKHGNRGEIIHQGDRKESSESVSSSLHSFSASSFLCLHQKPVYSHQFPILEGVGGQVRHKMNYPVGFCISKEGVVGEGSWGNTFVKGCSKSHLSKLDMGVAIYTVNTLTTVLSLQPPNIYFSLWDLMKFPDKESAGIFKRFNLRLLYFLTSSKKAKFTS